MTVTSRIKGLSLKVSALGENDRLLTILSDKAGVIRLAIPGARKPKSIYAAAAPLTFLDLQITGKSGLKRVKQMNVLRSFSNIGKQIETLAAAQALAELSMMLIASNDPQPIMLNTVLIHLERLEQLTNNPKNQILILANSVQSCIHILALGGYSIPVQKCSRSGQKLEPPIGKWEWRCSLLPDEGFIIGSIPNAVIQLNPSELALLQRLFKPNLPISKKGNVMGPKETWIKLLIIVEEWISNHLPKKVSSLKMLREILINTKVNLL